jgi:hypothetical protein
VGLRIYPTHRKLKKKSLRKMKARLKYVAKEYAEGRIDYDKLNLNRTKLLRPHAAL